MTTFEHLVRCISKSDTGECCHGTKAVERSNKEAIEGRPDAACRQGLRRRGEGSGGGTANGIYVEKAAG